MRRFQLVSRVAAIIVLAGCGTSQDLAHRATEMRRAPSANPVGRQAAIAASATCLLGSQMYDHHTGTQDIFQNPIYLMEYYAGTGQGPVTFTSLAAPPVIDLAWGPDFSLYGVTNAVPQGQNANSLFRIDPTTGAAARLGAIGQQLARDGDLSTDPMTGTIYGVEGDRLFVFSGLTPTAAGSSAQLVWQQIPMPGPSWSLIGLAFDSTGIPYALARSPGPNGPRGAASLLQLDLTTQTVTATIPLTLPVRNHGAMEFANNRLYFAEGFRPGASGWSYTNDDRILEIDRTTGAVQHVEDAIFQNGLSSLVSCRPHLQICRPPPPDMVAWYPMDGNPNDRILSQNATPSGNVVYSSSQVAQAANLYSGYLTVPAGPTLNMGLGDFSIELWIDIRPETLTAGVGTILDKREYVNGVLRGWSLMEYNGRIGMQLADGSYSNYYDGLPLAVGYHHIAVTVDRDNPQGLRFYVDGQARPPLNPTDRQGNLDNNAPTYIGRHAFYTAPDRWVGLDELQFFDRVLTPLEIEQIWDAQAAGYCKI